MNGHYIRASQPGRIIGLCLPYLLKAGLISNPPTETELEYVRKVVPLEQERMKMLSEVTELVGFFFQNLKFPEGYDEKAVKKWLGVAHLRPMLEKEIAGYGSLSEWTAEGLEAVTRQVGEELEVKFAEIIHPTRVATTGRTTGPGLFETLHVLGRERVLERLTTVLNSEGSRE